jgi:hypothetical protein
MTEWQRFDPSLLFPEGMDAVLNAADPLVSALSTTLEVLGTIVQTAGAFAGGMVDAQQALIDAVNEAIDAVIQQLLSPGIYWTFHMPPSLMSRLTPAAWCSDVGRSIQDYTDANRPILPTPGFVGGVALVAVSDTYSGLMSEYRKFFELLGKLIATADQLGRWPNREDPWIIKPGIGMAPDWSSKNLADVVPALGALARILMGFKESVSAVLSTKDLYSQFAEILTDKAEWLQGWATSIQEILATLSALLNFEGTWALPVYGEFTDDQITDILINSTGGPRDLLSANYTAGAFFLGVGGTEGDAVFDLFGLSKEVTSL